MQPPHHVADHPRARHQRSHDLPHHPVPGRGDHLADRNAVLDHGKLVAEGTADELKRLIPGGHIRLRFADAAGLETAARAFDEGLRDDDALTLQIPSDGGVGSLRALLDRLDHASIEVQGLTVHTPDLDDVFFALTGHPTTEQAVTPKAATL